MPEPWAELGEELSRWAHLGRTASLWWRDDDAVDVTPQLQRLLVLAADSGTAPALAVIPAGATAALRVCLGARSDVDVLQHGYAHRNHAPAGTKKMELGEHREAPAIAAELRQGRRVLADYHGALPVLVPPWNRIDDGVRALLPGCGLRGLSGFTPRTAATDAYGLSCCNTHVDPIDWRGSRGFCGDAATLAQLTAHLRARRLGECDADEATGLLTHHLVQDEATWAFCAALFAFTVRREGVRWTRAAALFAT